MIAHQISTRLYPVRADLGTLESGTSQTFYLLAPPAGTPSDDKLRVLICTRPSYASSLKFPSPSPLAHCPIRLSRHLTISSLDPIAPAEDHFQA
jgi:hypothetical protein